MKTCRVAAIRRQAVSGFAYRWLQAGLLALLGLLAASWSDESAAQVSCVLSPVSSTAQIGPINTTLTYTYEIGTGCAIETGTFAIIADTTGGATLSTAVWNQNNNTQFSVTVTLGPTPGGQGTLRTECTSTSCNGQAVSATFATNNQFTYVPFGGLTVTASQISPFTVSTFLQINGAPGTLQTSFNNLTSGTPYGNVTPSAGGVASTTQSIFAAGAYVVRGQVVCPTAFVLEGCAAVPPVDFNVQVEPAGVSVVGSATPSTPAGTPLPLTVYYGSASIPAQDGSNMFWTLLTQPAGGNGVVTGGVVAGGSGESNASFSATVPGVYEVGANSGCTFCAPGGVTYSITVTALTNTLTPVTPNPASGTVGVPIPFTVQLEQGGVPVNAANIQWTAAAPFAPLNVASVTDPAGEANASFTASAAGTFPGAIVAEYDPDGIPASGDEVSFAFDVTVASVPTLVINGGDSQTTTVGNTFPDVLSVLAQDSGAPAVGIGIDWVVTSGSATFVPSGPTDGTGEAHISLTPTAPGPITVTATRLDAPAATVTFNVTATAIPFLLTPVSPNPASGTVGVAIPFTVSLDQGGVPVNAANIQWTAGAPFAPLNFASVTDPAGQANASFTASAAGNFPGAIVAEYDPDGVPASGDEVSFAFDVSVATVPTLVINGGDGQTTTVGNTYPDVLSVVAQDSGAPATGIGIDWVVTSGSATFVASGPTDGTGEANISVTPTAPGPITITASRQDAPTVTVTFNLNATALPYFLNPVTPNPADGIAGTAMPLTVRLLQGGTPVVGATIQWAAAAPFAPATTNSITNAAGDAAASFTSATAGNFANVITALFDPDGVPASGDEVSFTYDANIAFVASLAISGGNNQNALVNTAYAAPLQVTADNSGVAAPGVGINWLVTSGDATLSAAASVTDAAGNAVVSVTSGATAGPVTISATRQDDATATVSFDLTVEALGTLTILSGNGQPLASGVASAPLEVELKDAGDLPIAGAVVSWTTTAGTLANATSTTDAAGIASNTVTTTAAGAVDVTASSPLAAAPAVFTLNGALAGLTSLSPTQLAVAVAIDNACPALAALPTRTPQQQDLLDRCLELGVAAGIDPPSVIGALDELMADVALTQANAAFNAAQSQFQNLKTRIAALRSGTGGTSFGGLALNTPTGPVSLGTLATAFSNSADTTEVGTDFSRWGFFAAGTIGRGEADAGSRNPAYDFDINGLTAGVDYRRNDKWIVGGALGFTRQDTTLPDGRGGLDTSGWTVSAYSTYYQQDSWYMDGVVTWGRNDYELIREISYTLPVAGGGTSTISQVAEADSGGDLLSTAFTFGRDFNRGAWGIGPYGRLLYTRLTFDAINEELLPGVPGSGLGLRIENRDISSLASVLGAKFTYTHSTDWGVLMPHVQLEWEHEFKDDPQSLEARFINDPTATAMVIRGDPLDTDYFRLGLGMSMVLTRGRSGFFYYEQLLGRSGMSHFSLALGFRMEF